MINDGFIRVAAAIPAVSIADVNANVDSINTLVHQLDSEHVHIAVFPEMCLTAYTCADLFHSSTLIEQAVAGLERLCRLTADTAVVTVVGLPVIARDTMYNCAAVISGGKLHGLVPKSYIPNYNEFYEKRWWASGHDLDTTVNMCGTTVRLSRRQLFKVGEALMGVEICEDLWTPVPPSCQATMAGADIIVNLSASDALIGKHHYLLDLVKQQSARCLCGYVYASAGYGESSTDLVFDGIGLVARAGTLLAKNTRWQTTPRVIVSDLDLEAIRRDRLHIGSFHDCAVNHHAEYDIIPVADSIHENSNLLLEVSPTPFVPPVDSLLRERCHEILNIQAAGMAKRLEATHCHHLVVGISGGLDSTLALLVATRAFDRLGLDRRGIVAVTMPGFGTTGRTYTNACNLVRETGATLREISITAAVNQHFSDIGHDPSNHDVTYENSQARERTQILMDLANQVGGMVLGTGDLSELALGWATYNGDHMSMYGVNASVPKTLVKYLVSYHVGEAREKGLTVLADTLSDILDTPVSPELIPADKDGNISQITEDLVGPYELHDFFMYYMLRYGFGPRRIFRLALHAFGERYKAETVRHWLRIFVRRFFAQQFKRSCLPDGPKVGSVCLSPRGDWRMPSDASAAMWLRECDAL